MENVVDKYLDWKKIETFMLFLKNSANWLCLINDDFNKSCSVHWFLIGAKNEINQLLWEEKINVFLNFAKKTTKKSSCLFMNFILVLMSALTI